MSAPQIDRIALNDLLGNFLATEGVGLFPDENPEESSAARAMSDSDLNNLVHIVADYIEGQTVRLARKDGQTYLAADWVQLDANGDLVARHLTELAAQEAVNAENADHDSEDTYDTYEFQEDPNPFGDD